MTPAEARSVVLRHLYAMPAPATITATEMHTVEPSMSAREWDVSLWDMGRWTPQGRLLEPVARLDVRGDTTRWALTGQGWATARRLTGEPAA